MYDFASSESDRRLFPSPNRSETRITKPDRFRGCWWTEPTVQLQKNSERLGPTGHWKQFPNTLKFMKSIIRSDETDFFVSLSHNFHWIFAKLFDFELDEPTSTKKDQNYQSRSRLIIFSNNFDHRLSDSRWSEIPGLLHVLSNCTVRLTWKSIKERRNRIERILVRFAHPNKGSESDSKLPIFSTKH